MKTVIKLLSALALMLAAAFNSEAKEREIYATVNTQNLDLLSGPGREYPVIEELQKGTKLTVLSIDNLKWIKVKSPNGNTGYALSSHLAGDFLMEFMEANPEYKKLLKEVSETSKEAFNSTVNVFDKMLYWFSNNARLGFTLGLIALALVIGLIILIRIKDPKYELWYLYYILYFITIIPTAALTYTPRSFWESNDTTGNLLTLLMTLIPGVMAIFGGWGVRQSGMTDGTREKNSNFTIGEALQFPAWMLIIATLYLTICRPVIEWSGHIVNNWGDEHFGSLMLGTIICAAITYCTLQFIWRSFIVMYLLKPAGNSVIKIMTAVIWFTIAKIAHNWIYDNYYGVLYIVAFILVWGTMTFILFKVLEKISETRCPMCHGLGGETNMRMEGTSTRTSEDWEKMKDSDIKPKSYGADVTGAKRLVSTTNVYDHWTTEHTCYDCKYKWTIQHSKLVNTISNTIEKRWYESN